ncbi:hypothetical protein NQ314_019072 [Rhamnusium bicolor]|uniref:Uncharacterized protein n=1 Tax=Rhamnusium bicolor TaxID=1586634 RepID=A0AAV8WPW8_9CUCU|nr:hypothetical protein NQ314_019072 [Rhamnusium bicolor]
MDLDPITKSQIQMKLFQNVENVKDLRKKLMNGQLKCCIIKPALIFDPFQIVIAANKALTAEKLTTKSIFTEVLFNLSLSKNITKSLQTFGIDDKDKHLLIVTFSREGEKNNDDVYKEIVGEELNLSDLTNFSDLNAIKKTYKISEKEHEEIPLIDSIVSRIATKDFLSH